MSESRLVTKMHQSFSLLRWYCSKDPSRAHYNPVHFVKEDGNLVLGKWAVTRLVFSLFPFTYLPRSLALFFSIYFLWSVPCGPLYYVCVYQIQLGLLGDRHQCLGLMGSKKLRSGHLYFIDNWTPDLWSFVKLNFWKETFGELNFWTIELKFRCKKFSCPGVQSIEFSCAKVHLYESSVVKRPVV